MIITTATYVVRICMTYVKPLDLYTPFVPDAASAGRQTSSFEIKMDFAVTVSASSYRYIIAFVEGICSFENMSCLNNSLD